MDNATADMPITALCILADKSKVPQYYMPVDKAYDTRTELDLWKDGLFAKRANRFICFTKEFPLKTNDSESWNVIEDILLFNDKEIAPGGYIAIEKTGDSGEKAFQRKVLHAKVSLRHYTDTAISDIILLAKDKRAPAFYSSKGEINGCMLCVRYSKIPKQKAVAPSISDRIKSGSATTPTRQLQTPVYPHNTNQIQMPMPYGAAAPNSDFYRTVQRIFDSAASYNPLEGVPFEIDSIYKNNTNSNNDEDIDTDLIDKYASEKAINDTLSKYEYDFSLERSVLNSMDTRN